MIAFDPNIADAKLDPNTERMIRVAAGDRGAFDELVRRNYSSTVRIISAMMGSTSQSEDIAQEVFLRIYRSRVRYLPTARFATFLGTIIRNTVLNAKRSQSRSRARTSQFVDERWRHDGKGETMPAPAIEFDLPRELDVQQTVANVNHAIGQLPTRQRTAIELVHFRGLSYMSAAQEMDTSSKAVKSLLGRGRATLGNSLHDEYCRRFGSKS
jgi:RNA polymerase sigma-70 factor (ECF subfamily)